eukprot:CAMPEP_0195510756 /NCGR_PEP_ID=MMETSP0794_2-20130614/3310_1 /TAXON_ID=515487 /ORGANISM="Stephanopyxis turris, Strain CCMP 815" /LENGTH=92 /DNA_ID=CAMNT_0040638239 /DNA_START=246 /DNA_END=520 /DNA_ORIENTATION=+
MQERGDNEVPVLVPEQVKNVEEGVDENSAGGIADKKKWLQNAFMKTDTQSGKISSAPRQQANEKAKWLEQEAFKKKEPVKKEPAEPVSRELA